MSFDYVPEFPGRTEVINELEDKPSILKFSWPPSIRSDVESTVYEACYRQFGTPVQIQWFHAPFDEDYFMTNEVFLHEVTLFNLPTTKPATGKSSTRPSTPTTSATTTTTTTSIKIESVLTTLPGDGAEQQDKREEDCGASSPKVSSTASNFASSEAHDESSTPRRRSHRKVSETSEYGIVPGKPVQSRSKPKTAESKAKARKPEPATTPDQRTFVVSVLLDEGMDFEQCRDAQDLCLCLLHSTLGKVDFSSLLESSR